MYTGPNLIVGLAFFTTVYTCRSNATYWSAVMSFSGSCHAVAKTPVRGTLRAHAAICLSYFPAAAPAWSPPGGFQDTKECSPAARSPAAADALNDDGSEGSKLRRMVS